MREEKRERNGHIPCESGFLREHGLYKIEFVFLDRISLCIISGCPRICYEDQASLEPTELHLLLCIKDTTTVPGYRWEISILLEALSPPTSCLFLKLGHAFPFKVKFSRKLFPEFIFAFVIASKEFSK